MSVTALLSKHGAVVTALAHTLLDHAPGDRIESVQSLAARLDASVGTVQAALEYLQSVGGAQLHPRGRKGTFAGELNYPLLWALAMQRPLVGALPLPYSLHLIGLATGLRAQFDRGTLDLELRFVRGAMRRLEALAAHECDWALVSRFSTERARAADLGVEPVLSLGPGSYMAGHALVTRAEAGGQLSANMRVGIDPASGDHAHMVHSVVRGMPVELVPIEYAQGLGLISRGVIDATVWSAEDVPESLASVALEPHQRAEAPTLDRLNEAVLLVARGSRGPASLLRTLLVPENVRSVQREVVRGERLPAY